MSRITLEALSESDLHNKISSYYEALSLSQGKKSLKRSKKRSERAPESSGQVFYDVSPEYGLRTMSVNPSGTVDVSEIRMPLVVDLEAWSRKLKQFNTVELQLRCKDLRNRLLLNHPQDTPLLRLLVEIQAPPKQVDSWIEPIRKTLSQELGLIKNDTQVGIYSSEQTQTVIAIDLNNFQKDNLQRDVLTRVLRSVTGMEADGSLKLIEVSELFRSSGNTDPQDVHQQEQLVQEYQSYIAILRPIRQLLRYLEQSINDRTQRRDNIIRILRYCDSLNEIAIQKMLKDVIDKNPTTSSEGPTYPPECDQDTLEHHLNNQTRLFSSLRKQLSFVRPGSRIGASVIVDGEQGVIVGKDASKFMVEKNSDKSIVKLPESSLVLKNGCQNKLYKALHTSIGTNELVADLPSTFNQVAWIDLAGYVYDKLIALGFNYCPAQLRKTVYDALFPPLPLLGFYPHGVRHQRGGMNAKDVNKEIQEAEKKGSSALFKIVANKNLLSQLKHLGVSYQASQDTFDGLPNQWSLKKQGTNWLASLNSKDQVTLDLGKTTRQVKESIGEAPASSPSPQTTEAHSTSRVIEAPEIDSPPPSAVDLPDLSTDDAQLSRLTTEEFTRRPYLLQYQTTVTSGKILPLPEHLVRPSKRPKRTTKQSHKKTIRGSRTTPITLQLNKTSTDSGTGFQKIDNPNDVMGDEDIDRQSLESRDQLIISGQNLHTPVGAARYERVSQDYSQLQGIPDWRGLLDQTSRTYKFNLVGVRWESIHQAMGALKLEPVINQAWNKVGGGGVWQDSGLYEKMIRGDSSSTNEITAPRYWSHSLTDLDTQYPQWFTQITRYFGLEKGALLENQGDISFENLLLKRLTYSLYQANETAAAVLLATGNSSLLSACQGSYCTLHSLMETRELLRNRIIPSFYNSTQEERLFQERNVRVKLTSGIFRWAEKRHEIPTVVQVKNDLNIILGREARDSEESKTIDALIPVLLLQHNKQLQTSVGLALERRATYSGTSELASQQYQQGIVNLLTSTNKQGVHQLLENPELHSKVSDLEIETLDNYLQGEGLLTYNVPSNGDCLFYSIVDSLWYKELVPMDFTQDSHYSPEKIKKEVSISSTPQSVYGKAALQARKELSDKILANRDEAYISEQGDTVTTLEQAVVMELQNLVTPEQFSQLAEPFTTYTEMVKTSGSGYDLSEGEQRGIWGSEIELQAAAALYNVDIRLFVMDQNGRLQSPEGTYYLASDARKRFPHGKSYAAETQEIISLAWIQYSQSSAHYVSTRPIDKQLLLLVGQDGSVKRSQGEVLLLVGTDFNPETGRFNLLTESSVTEASPDPRDQEVSMWYHKNDVYYQGDKIGSRSDTTSGIQFPLKE